MVVPGGFSQGERGCCAGGPEARQIGSFQANKQPVHGEGQHTLLNTGSPRQTSCVDHITMEDDMWEKVLHSAACRESWGPKT